ncbi:hypothetical protein [Roseinatronobacter sp.]
MRGVICSIAAGLMATQAAAEFPFTPEAAASAFNAAAQDLGVVGGFQSTNCGSDVRTACTISTSSSHLVALVNGDPGENADEVSVIFTPDGTDASTLSAFSVWATVITSIDPGLSADERGEIITPLATAVGSGADGEVSMNDTTYRMMIMPQVGILFIAESDS